MVDCQVTVLKWRCSPPTQHRIQALGSASHMLTCSSGPHMGDCILAQAWLSPPGWPGEPLALPSHPLGLSTTTGPGHRTGGSSGTHAEPRGGRGDREEVKRRGSRLPFGLYFSIKRVGFCGPHIMLLHHSGLLFFLFFPALFQKFSPESF